MKPNITTIIILFLFILTIQSLAFAQQNSLAEAKLVIDSYTPKKDSTLSIGVLINLKDDWHIYWRNPGDSGLPTEIEFILPNGVTASEIKFPIPEIFTSDEIVNYGYSHQVLLMSELSIPNNFSQKEISLSAKITSLICKDLCKAFDTTLTIKIDLSKDIYPTKLISDEFDFTKSILPIKNHTLKTSAITKSDSVYLKVSGDEIINVSNIKFLSYNAGIFRNSIKQNVFKKENHFEIILEPDPFRVNSPTLLNGIIILNDDQTKAFEISIPITN
jgi:thiol:disulfide interchange protein DsbD